MPTNEDLPTLPVLVERVKSLIEREADHHHTMTERLESMEKKFQEVWKAIDTLNGRLFWIVITTGVAAASALVQIAIAWIRK